MIQGKDGNFYGTTFYGGPFTAGAGSTFTGMGTVYRITPAGEETVIYAFKGPSVDGDAPTGTLVQDSAGNFYGTTCNGCSTIDGGTVFKVTPAGVETVLYNFGESEGSDPDSVIVGSNGNLYGTAAVAGAGGGGIVFLITPSGAETVLYSFGRSYVAIGTKPGTDGSSPTSVIQGRDGNLYGTTAAGGASASSTSAGDGVVFKITL